MDRDTGLRFDPALGFHLYGADLCLAARRAGLAAVVVEGVCLHNSQTVALSPSFGASAAAFAAKWANEMPVTTPSAHIGPGGKVSVW